MTNMFKISEGHAAPLGPSVTKTGVNFALFSAHATSVYLCLFSSDGAQELARLAMMRSGDIWHGHVGGIKAGALYGYRVDGPYAPHDGHRFNVHKLLIDPYAKMLFGDFIQHDALYGFDVSAPDKDLSFNAEDSAPFMPKCVVGEPDFDWRKSAAPQTDWADTIIYEAHVKGLTMRRTDIDPALRGTLSGLSDPAIIAHLKSLGVSAIELLPVQSFFSEPRLTQMGLTNYWGYNPVNYFAAHNPYLGPKGQGAFQSAVKALHKAGIEVILDVVYNHTAESWELGPTLSYRGIDNASYYHLAGDKRFYVNHTGCGNTLDMTHPQVLALTLESLRYWATTMGVDGFRFDLAPTLARNPHDFDASAAFLTAVKSDPVLSTKKLIAEPWDIGPGGYVLGQFPRQWAEWNDRYRDDARSFWRGDDYAHKALAGRLLGSADIFDHDSKSAFTSINFITAHDGFNLTDTVSYNDKHNHANGEDNRDGHGHNLSDNMGAEGPSDDPAIIAARRQRKKNMLATLILSQGIPMLLAGDEIGHSQRGNNNAYCQDNEITWLDWAQSDEALLAFTAALIDLRKTYPHFSQAEFLHGEALSAIGPKNVQWLSPAGEELQGWEWDNPKLACMGMALSLPEQGSVIVVSNRGEQCHFDFGGATLERLLSSAEQGDDLAHIPADSVSVFHCAQGFLPKSAKAQALRDVAVKYNIVDEFRDITGHIHHTSDESREALLGAMGVETRSISELSKALETAPALFPDARHNAKVYGADMLRGEGKCWGVTAALYGLRSTRNWGVGDFEDLAVLAEIAAKRGADFIGINPVHALFPSAPDLYSPYSPSSRRFLNVMCIAPDKVPDLPKGFAVDTDALRAPPHVDYAAVSAAKMSAFEAAFEAFCALGPRAKRRRAFEAFIKDQGQALRGHAVFEVLFERLPKSKRTYEGWQNFARKYHDPNSKACAQFAAVHESRIRFYSYLQWLAHEQLAMAQARVKAAGMRIGIYLDFAVGVVPGGSDSWLGRAAYARAVSLGAPGDKTNPDGQMWNLLPFDPHVLAANNYEPYRSALRAAMALGGAVRIDHILGHLRSFWIPEGAASGAYVRYPFDGLIAMIAKESQDSGCVIFGEDLGTVPDDFRARMAGYDLMGCNIALFERDSQGGIIPAAHMRDLSITAFSNHDFPTLTGFWEGRDFVWREALGIGADPEVLGREKAQRARDKAAFADLVGAEADAPMSAQLMADLQAYLAESPALAFAIPLDDLMLEPLQANVPGTTDEQPNWRRRAKMSLEQISDDQDVALIMDAIHNARKPA